MQGIALADQWVDQFLTFAGDLLYQVFFAHDRSKHQLLLLVGYLSLANTAGAIILCIGFTGSI